MRHFHGFVTSGAYNLEVMTKVMPKYSEYLLLMLLVWLIPDVAFAQVGPTPPPTPATNNSVANVICGVVNVITGPVGSAVAMLGVISIGLIAMFGKIQVSSVLTVLTGIAIIFGAPNLLAKLVPTITACGTGVSAVTIGADQFATMLGCIVSLFVGPVGKTLATLSLVLMGIFATYGRISWHQAMLVAVGIATIFGSAAIVQSLGVPVDGGNSVDITSLCGAGLSSVVSVDMIFCNLMGWFKGSIGKGIATIGMLVIGFGALFGKVSWGIAMVFAVGIGLIFGSESVIVALGAPHVAGSDYCTITKTLTTVITTKAPN